MIATIIINTKNQNEFLERALKSCLKQNFFNYEIIIADLTKKKNYIIRKKYKQNFKIKFIDIKEKFLYPTQNQLHAIKLALKYSLGDDIYLLDGDDYFFKEKVNYISKIIKKKNFVMDLPLIFNEKNKKIVRKMKINYLKKKYWYNFLINKWPSISCTSAICIKKKKLNEFFIQTDPFRWKYLAIDIQLAIYTTLEDSIYYINKDLTYKSQNSNNLDKNYSNFLSKNYWLRRNEQHDFYLTLKKENNFLGFDYYITKIISFFIKIIVKS
jgi:glycosyltransferase involved in cell wall biosynthesis